MIINAIEKADPRMQTTQTPPRGKGGKVSHGGIAYGEGILGDN